MAHTSTAAKSLQSCPTLCDPIDSSPPGSPIPGILQARTLEWVVISFSDACMHAKTLQSCLTLLWLHAQQPTRLLRPWDSLGKNTGVGWHFLLQIWLLRSCVYIVHKVNWLCNLIPCHILLVPSILNSSGFFFLWFYLFLAVLGLCCCMGFALVATSRGYSLVAVCRLLLVESSLVTDRGLWAQRPQYLRFLAPEHRLTGMVAPRQVGPPRIRGHTCVSCAGRQILYPWTTKEAHSVQVLSC